MLQRSKLMVCAFCNSTLFIEDAQVASAGEKSVLTEVPSILVMGQHFHAGNWTFEPVGRIRYEYGDSAGYWDEWWVQLSTGKTKWISNDEGEYVIQNEFNLKGDPPPYETFTLGQQVKLLDDLLQVTELNHATCTGLEGQLPEVVRPGDSHRYAHLEGAKGVLVTAEYDEESVVFYKGAWIDPFEIKPA